MEPISKSVPSSSPPRGPRRRRPPRGSPMRRPPHPRPPSCSLVPLARLDFGPLQWGEKKKKIHELQLRFSYRLFGMPAEANFGGALADITVTTSYRGTALDFACRIDAKLEIVEECSIQTPFGRQARVSTTISVHLFCLVEAINRARGSWKKLTNDIGQTVYYRGRTELRGQRYDTIRFITLLLRPERPATRTEHVSRRSSTK